MSLGPAYGKGTGGSGDGMPVAPEGAYFVAQGDTWFNSLVQTGSGRFVWDDDTTATAPPINRVKGNDAVLANITELYINDSTLNGYDFTTLLNKVTTNDFFVFSLLGSPTNHLIVTVTGDTTDNGGWHTIPVQVEDVGGGFLLNDVLITSLFPLADRTFGRNYNFEDEDSTSSTGSTSWQTKTTMNLTVPEDGTYHVGASAELTNSDSDKPVEFRVRVDGTTVMQSYYAPKFEDEYLLTSGFESVDLTAGASTILIQFRSTSEGGTARIRNSRIEAFRTS